MDGSQAGCTTSGRKLFGYRALAGSAVMLVLVLTGLALGSLTRPGLAAASPDRVGSLPPRPPARLEAAGPASLAPAQELTHTVFLPVVIRPRQLPTNAWKAEYYANANLDEPAAYTQEETRVDYDWGDDSGPPGLPSNQFSVRWTGNWAFESGKYTFFLYADDGVRLWLDDDLLVDSWTMGAGWHYKTVSFQTPGLHRLQLDYFEGLGEAAVQLRWRRTDLYPRWRGDYYNQPWVESGWLYARDDDSIQFDWGESCPPNLPCDGFSISWTATPLFEPGTHRIFLYADEGYQLYVGDTKVMEGGWFDGQGGGSEDASYDLEVGAIETRKITYNFHDRGTLAEARLWIEYLEHPTWTVEVYDNANLADPPQIVDPDGQRIFFDWGLGKPKPWGGIGNSDYFSIRWSGQRYFHAGCYRFGLFVDDGARLWVDGELLIDEWHLGRAEYHSLVTFLDTGYHDVVIEYFENTGSAEIRFWWE